MARLPDFAQCIVAFDVGLRLGGERQSIGRLYGWWVDRLAVDQSVQHVQDMRLGWGACLQCEFDGSEHGLLVVLEDKSQNLDDLALPWPPGVLSMRCCRVRKAGGSSANGAPLRSAPGLR